MTFPNPTPSSALHIRLLQAAVPGRELLGRIGSWLVAVSLRLVFLPLAFPLALIITAALFPPLWFEPDTAVRLSQALGVLVLGYSVRRIYHIREAAHRASDSPQPDNLAYVASKDFRVSGAVLVAVILMTMDMQFPVIEHLSIARTPEYATEYATAHVANLEALLRFSGCVMVVSGFVSDALYRGAAWAVRRIRARRSRNLVKWPRLRNLRNRHLPIGSVRLPSIGTP
jgi:hypothetical protein